MYDIRVTALPQNRSLALQNGCPREGGGYTGEMEIGRGQWTRASPYQCTLGVLGCTKDILDTLHRDLGAIERIHARVDVPVGPVTNLPAAA